jgi:hypothetical protein
VGVRGCLPEQLQSYPQLQQSEDLNEPILSFAMFTLRDFKQGKEMVLGYGSCAPCVDPESSFIRVSAFFFRVLVGGYLFYLSFVYLWMLIFYPSNLNYGGL